MDSENPINNQQPKPDAGTESNIQSNHPKPEVLGASAQPQPKPAPHGYKVTCDKKRDWIDKTTLGLEGFGLFVLVVYTIATIWYACITNKQWHQMRKTNEINKDVAHKQLRAYIGAEPGVIRDFAADNTPQIGVTVNNYGQTPAYKARSYCNAKVLPYPSTESGPFPFNPEQRIEFGSVGPIYPHTPLPTGKKMDGPISKEEIAEVLNGDKFRLYIGGIVQYEDIFGTSHCTRYLASMGGIELREQIAFAKTGGKPIVPWRWSNNYNDEDKCDQAQK